MGAYGVNAVVLGEPGIGGRGLQQGEPGRRALDLGQRDRSVQGDHRVVSQPIDIDTPRPSEARKGSMVIEQEGIELARTQPERAL